MNKITQILISVLLSVLLAGFLITTGISDLTKSFDNYTKALEYSWNLELEDVREATLDDIKIFGASIPKVVALFETSLAEGIISSDTSMTLVSGTDKSGDSLSGYICFTIGDSEEFVCGTASGTSITSMIRGIDPIDGDLEVASLKKSHRRGSSVKITNYPSLTILTRILNGDETFPNIIKYNSQPTFNNDEQIITKKYADDLAIAGAPDASFSVKGLVEMATTSEVILGSSSGSTTAPLCVPNQLFNATSSATTLIPVAKSGKISQGFLDLTQEFTFSSSTITNLIAPTLTSTTFSATGLSTMATTTFSIIPTAPTSTPTLAGQLVALDDSAKLPAVDGSQLTNVILYKTGQTTYDMTTASGAQNIAHGLGRIPKIVRLRGAHSGANFIATSQGAFDGTTNSVAWVSSAGAGAGLDGGDTTNGIYLVENGSLTNYQRGIISVDATNIIITWTKVASPSGTAQIQWEVEG